MQPATGNSLAPSDIGISTDEIRSVLEPWTIRSHPSDAPAWQTIRSRKAHVYRRKRLRRLLGSAVLPRIKSRKYHRDPEFVNEHYSETWARYLWPEISEPPGKANTVYLEWDGTGYEALRHALVRVHLLGIAKVIQSLGPNSVLEVGAGPGINLLSLSASFPDIGFAGVELTESGVLTAKSMQAGPLPEAIEHCAPMGVKSRSAHQRIAFKQCDVRNIPHPDEAFDLVFTRLAIEQMEQIRDRALAEIHRVTRSYAVFVEPFRDFNLDPLKSLATRAKNYISLSVDELPRYGFEPVFRFSDWPHKITNGAGLVVCRKV